MLGRLPRSRRRTDALFSPLIAFESLKAATYKLIRRSLGGLPRRQIDLNSVNDCIESANLNIWYGIRCLRLVLPARAASELDLTKQYRLDLSANQVAYERAMAALEMFASTSGEAGAVNQRFELLLVAFVCVFVLSAPLVMSDHRSFLSVRVPFSC